MPTPLPTLPLPPTLSLAGAWELHLGDVGTPLGSSPDWRAVSVPHQWHPAGLTPPADVAWYRRRFEVPAAPPGTEAHLCFAGVDYEAEVWVDGTWRAGHVGYFQPFAVALGALAPGWHDLAVRVAAPREERPRHKRQVKGALGWHPTRPGGLHEEHGLDVSTGGLWGEVNLSWRPILHLAALGATTRFAGDRARVQVDVTLSGPVATATAIDLTLADPQGDVVARAVATLAPGEAAATAVLDVWEPRRWQPWDQGEQPLYRLEALLAGDRLARRIGLREVGHDGEVLLVNGVRTFMRGVHHVPTLFLSDYDGARARADVRLLVDAGANVVRVHAHVTHPAFYDACDEAGLLVWQDCPLYGGYEDDGAVAAEAARQARAMVELLGPRPAVVGWTALTDGGAGAEALGPLVAGAIAACDPEARPVVAHACLSGRAVSGDRHALRELEAPLAHAVGAQALPPLDALRALLPAGAAWPPAWEAWAWHGFDWMQAFWVAGLALPDDPEALVAASQAHQATYLRDALDQLRRTRFAPGAGVFVFLLAEPWAGLGWGVTDHARTPKEGYYALAEAFQPVYPSLRVPSGPHRAGLALRPDLVIINDRAEALDDVVVTLSIAGPDGVERASVASIPLTVPANGTARVFPEHGDPLPTHPAWRGTYWLEAVVKRQHRPIGRAVREIVLDAPPEGLAAYRVITG